MIQIHTNSSFIKEKEYTFHVLFREILGLDFCIHTSSEIQNYIFELPNNSQIELNDTFFSAFDENRGYCNKENIPTEILKISYDFFDDEVPIIYGNNDFYQINENHMYCGIDVCASSFFMLSRWEEIAITERDSFDRFPENESLAVKQNFISQPIVHVYAELFRIIASKLHYIIPQTHTFTKTMSHDIDFMFKWNSLWEWKKNLLGDLIVRKSFYLAKQTWKNYFLKCDPYDTFSKLMDMSESNQMKSFFYFLNTPKNLKAIATVKGEKIFDSILNRGHIIGIHSNFYKDSELHNFLNDLHFWEAKSQQKIVLNRQHFLKFQVPETFRMLESAGIIQDSSLYYRHYLGFRTGMCIEHSLFDCQQREIMKIKELPLIFMDVTLLDFKDRNEIKQNIDTIIAATKKYKGNFVCLWHNSSFDEFEWKKIIPWYMYIMEA